MLNLIKKDLYRYQPIPFSFLGLMKGFRSQGFRYMFFRRIREHFGRRHLIGFFAAVMVRRYMYKFGFQIGGKIGPGFYIGHFGTIIVSNLAVIGSNCNIGPSVTIGATRRGPSKGAPSIGDNVWLGTNSIVVGKIEIGNDVLIAPGAFVNIDIPSHSIVIGNPCKIIAKQHATEGYINNVI